MSLLVDNKPSLPLILFLYYRANWPPSNFILFYFLIKVDARDRDLWARLHQLQGMREIRDKCIKLISHHVFTR
jgi:hypothetical protein